MTETPEELKRRILNNSSTLPNGGQVRLSRHTLWEIATNQRILNTQGWLAVLSLVVAIHILVDLF